MEPMQGLQATSLSWSQSSSLSPVRFRFRQLKQYLDAVDEDNDKDKDKEARLQP